LVKNLKNGISLSKLKMVAAAVLVSGNGAFFDPMDKFLFKVATLLPNLMKFGQK